MLKAGLMEIEISKRIGTDVLREMEQVMEMDLVLTTIEGAEKKATGFDNKEIEWGGVQLQYNMKQ